MSACCNGWESTGQSHPRGCPWRSPQGTSHGRAFNVPVGVALEQTGRRVLTTLLSNICLGNLSLGVSESQGGVYLCMSVGGWVCLCVSVILLCLCSVCMSGVCLFLCVSGVCVCVEVCVCVLGTVDRSPSFPSCPLPSHGLTLLPCGLPRLGQLPHS